MSAESKTPETDAVVGQREYGSLADSEYVRLARRLERERDEARSQCNLNQEAAEDAKRKVEQLRLDKQKAVAERDEARRERDALLEAHARHACTGESLADTLKRLRSAADSACDERDQLRAENMQMKEAIHTTSKERHGASGACCYLREQLHAENQTFRNAMKACEDCDAVTFGEVKQLRKVAEAAWRLSQYGYHDWALAGGADQCQHGIAAGIHCQRCDELLVKGWKERGA